MASDAPSGAAPRDHVSRVQGAGPAGGRRRRHARGRGARRDGDRSEPAKGTFRFYADAAMHLVDPLPYAVGKYRSREFQQRLNALLESEPFDLIVCDFLFPAVNLPKQLPCPAVMFTHNVESEIWRRHAETKTGIQKSLYGAQYAADAALRAADARALRRRPRRVRRRPRDLRAALSRRDPPAGARRADRRRYRVLRAAARSHVGTAAPRSSSSPVRWTGCRTKTRCSTSVATSCR